MNWLVFLGMFLKTFVPQRFTGINLSSLESTSSIFKSLSQTFHTGIPLVTLAVDSAEKIQQFIMLIVKYKKDNSTAQKQ
jgi:hypothetical protein